MESLLYFSVCGLMYDAAGVLLLGYAFFFQSKEALREELKMYWGVNPLHLKARITSKFDGVTGTILLFLGFSFQFIGQLYPKQEEAVLSLYILLVLGLIEYFMVVRKKRVQEWYDELSSQMQDDS